MKYKGYKYNLIFYVNDYPANAAFNSSHGLGIQNIFSQFTLYLMTKIVQLINELGCYL